jgi:dTDP-4-amino-4,6-dideoxygalactose transaminase
MTASLASKEPRSEASMSELSCMVRPRRSAWPVYEEDEIRAVADILKSGAVNSLHHGTYCRQFEQDMATLCDAPHAIAVANGTVALELALRSLGIGDGDEVIVPARSFMASASCVVACGATPVFADVDDVTQGISVASVEAVLGPRTKAIIAVHLAGWPCEMEGIMSLAQRKGIFVIEDCAQAHGARLKGRPVGSFGDAAAFSFCTDKIISTGGEGGMLVLKDRSVWKRAWAFKDHGKDPDHYASIKLGPDFLWLHDSVGSNYRLTEMQAAIGSLQLRKLPRWLHARRANAAVLDNELEGLEAVRPCLPPPQVEHARYKYYTFVRPERLKPGWDRRRIIQELANEGVACSTGSCPEIYLETAFAGHPSRPPERLPVARSLGETSLMLQIDHTLTPEDLTQSGAILRSVLEEASQ